MDCTVAKTYLSISKTKQKPSADVVNSIKKMGFPSQVTKNIQKVRVYQGID